MTSPNTNNVLAASPAATGGLLKGTSASILPTDASTALDNTFVPLGYVGDSGVKIKADVSTTDKRAWGGQIIKTVKTDSGAEVEFTLAEVLNVDALKAAYGEDAVVVTPATELKGGTVTLTFKGDLPDPAPYVVEARDGDTRIRVLVPNLAIKDLPGWQFDNSEILDAPLKGVAYPATVGAETDVLYKIWIEKDDATGL